MYIKVDGEELTLPTPASEGTTDNEQDHRPTLELTDTMTELKITGSEWFTTRKIIYDKNIDYPEVPKGLMNRYIEYKVMTAIIIITVSVTLKFRQGMLQTHACKETLFVCVEPIHVQ